MKRSKMRSEVQDRTTFIPDLAFDLIAEAVRSRMSHEEKARHAGATHLGLVAQVDGGPFTILLSPESKRTGRD